MNKNLQFQHCNTASIARNVSANFLAINLQPIQIKIVGELAHIRKLRTMNRE